MFRKALSDRDTGWREYNSNGTWRWVGEKDGILSDKEIAETTQLYTSAYVSSLKGIEYFTALQELGCGAYGQLTELDMSRNTALTALGCRQNRLTQLNVNGCSALKELVCYSNQLTKLDLSTCSALIELDCQNNQLTELNVSRCSALIKLECKYNQLTELDLSNDTALTWLSCHSNNLTQLDLSKNTALTELYCHDNQLTELDLSNNTSIVHYLKCSPQTREGMKAKLTDEGYEVDLSEYVSKLENIVSDSIRAGKAKLLSFNVSSGIVLFSEYPSELFYQYNTHSPNETYMDVTLKGEILKVEALERGGFDTDNIICDMTPSYYIDKQGQKLSEATIAGYNYGTYGKLGFTADGNSRLILRVQTDKPGYATFQFDDNIGATLENLDRQKLSATSQVRTSLIGFDIDDNEEHQISVVLIAPEMFPKDKNFPSDTFKVHVNFYADDGTTAEKDLELRIEAAPVLLIPGIFDNAGNTFGFYKNTGVYRALLNENFDVAHIDMWDYDGSYGSDELLAFDSDLFEKLVLMFNQYAYGGIVCTKADIVAHGMGGLLARRFLAEIDQDLNDGNNWSIRSYKQGMVRRLITIATPHEGTPWADDIDKRRFITMMYNGILNTSFFDNHPYLTSLLDRVFCFKFGTLMVNSLVASPQLTRNSRIFNGNAWEEMKTNVPRSYGFPAGVPMHAIYGNIVVDGVYRDSYTLIAKLLVEPFMNIDINIYDIPSMIMSNIEKLTGSAKNRALFVFSLVRDIPDYMRVIVDSFTRGLFGTEANDLIVSASSASSRLKSTEYVNNGFDVIVPGIPSIISDKRDRYSHWSICQQLDVGEEVASLLKGSINEFTVFNSVVYETAKTTVQNSEVIPTDEIADAEELALIERLNLKVEPAVLNLNENDSQTVKFTVIAAEALPNDVYCTVGNDKACRFFKLPDVDGNGTRFEAELNAGDLFMSMDNEVIDVICFSAMLYDESNIDGMYVSNTVHVTPLTDLSEVNIVKLSFAEGETFYTNVNAETPAGLYGVDDNGVYYDISSSLMGTEWTADDPEIVSVSEAGMVQGLKEGTTTLRAEFNGLTAAISVDVGPAYEDSSDDPNPEPEPKPDPDPEPDPDPKPDPTPDPDPAPDPTPTPKPESVGHSGGGCNSSALGILALMLLITKKR